MNVSLEGLKANALPLVSLQRRLNFSCSLFSYMVNVNIEGLVSYIKWRKRDNFNEDLSEVESVFTQLAHPLHGLSLAIKMYNKPY